MKFTVHFIRFCYSEDDTFFVVVVFPILIHIKNFLGHFLTELLIILYFSAFVCFFLDLSF